MAISVTHCKMLGIIMLVLACTTVRIADTQPQCLLRWQTHYLYIMQMYIISGVAYQLHQNIEQAGVRGVNKY